MTSCTEHQSGLSKHLLSCFLCCRAMVDEIHTHTVMIKKIIFVLGDKITTKDILFLNISFDCCLFGY